LFGEGHRERSQRGFGSAQKMNDAAMSIESDFAFEHEQSFLPGAECPLGQLPQFGGALFTSAGRLAIPRLGVTEDFSAGLGQIAASLRLRSHGVGLGCGEHASQPQPFRILHDDFVSPVDGPLVDGAEPVNPTSFAVTN
jgi:hypothetical protein